VYREDFNFNPLSYWQAADAPDRVGMTEIRFVEGHYEFWDELRRRFGGLWIDNCASGGRLIDLETVSRSLPLWPSDFFDTIGLAHGRMLHAGDQCVSAGLARWVPLFGGGVWNFTPYGVRGHAAGGFTFGIHIDHKDFPPEGLLQKPDSNSVMAKGVTVHSKKFPFKLAKAAIAEQKSLREFTLGDYWPLVPVTAAATDWCAMQFHRDDLGAGVALIFRRHESPFDRMMLGLKRIDPKARYKVSIARTFKEPPRRTMTGRQLAKLVASIPKAPGSVLVRYTKIGKATQGR